MNECKRRKEKAQIAQPDIAVEFKTVNFRSVLEWKFH
jgi:hypothetical protein